MFFKTFKGCCWLSPSPSFARQSICSLIVWKKVHVTPKGYSSKQRKELSPCSQTCLALPSLFLLSLLQPHYATWKWCWLSLDEGAEDKAVSNNQPAPLPWRKCKAPVQTCSLFSLFRHAPQVLLGLKGSSPCLSLCSCSGFLPAFWCPWSLSSRQRGMSLCWKQQPCKGAVHLAFLLVLRELWRRSFANLCHAFNSNNDAYLLLKACFEGKTITVYK